MKAPQGRLQQESDMASQGELLGGNVQQVGRSKSDLRAVGIINCVSCYDAEVLITGPTGVGKKLYTSLAERSSISSMRFRASSSGLAKCSSSQIQALP